MGDLNLHFTEESNYLSRLGFVDAWDLIHPHEKGYTWDSQKNNIIKKFLLFDNRRMRLDRICTVASCSNLVFKDIRIEATETMPNNLPLSDHFMLFSHV